MPLLTTKGAGSASSLGITSASGPANYIEDMFSCFLYTGTGAAQTITNGIDLSTKGGLVWIKSRSHQRNHSLYDTNRGTEYVLRSNLTNGSEYQDGVRNFFTTGFGIGTSADINNSAETYVSWTFRKQPKFFDVVTWTGNYPTNYPRVLSHSLESTPGFVIIKRTDGVGSWPAWHRSVSTGDYNANQTLFLNTTAAAVNYGNQAGPFTSTTITVGENLNQAGQTFVAYLFAHDAGGFGLSGTDNAISCGSFTYVSGTLSVNLGYEPQWVMIKQTDGSGSWFINDNMRNWRADNSTTGTGTLYAQSSNAEGIGGADWNITSTGFNVTSGTGTFIYIAIRRGLMKVPTLGTSVYNAIARSGTGATADVTGVGFPVDLNWSHIRTQTYPNVMDDRLRGTTNTLKPSTTDPEAVSSTVTSFASMDGVQYGTSDRVNTSGNTYIHWYFRRAPGFFDEVCYTGAGGNSHLINHNLAAPAEMIFIKGRSYTVGWVVGTNLQATNILVALNTVSAEFNPASNKYYFGDGVTTIAPTSTQFTVRTGDINTLGNTYVAYLFATLAGISKCGSYTGTGALQTVNCGFTSGARFVLIKRTDDTGGWYVYDSTRGITSGNDPYLFANLDAVEVTNTNYVDTDSTGFKVTAAAPAELNANGGSYIFLAIA